MKIITTVLFASLLPATNAVALEKWGPTWSEVTGTRYFRATMNRAPAIIKSVDGRNYVDRIVKIEPGSSGKPGRIALSLRALEPDPWATVRERFPVGATVRGIVRERRLIRPGGFAGFRAFLHSGNDVLERLGRQLTSAMMKQPGEEKKKED